jgi:hypothetical protein
VATGTPTPIPTATATPKPTATPTPTPAPTATPTQPATGAIVSFTAAQKTGSFSNAMSACPSGCNVPAYSTGAHLETWYSNYWNYDQYTQTAMNGQISVLNENNNTFNGQVLATTSQGYTCQTAKVGLIRAGANPPPRPVTIECDFLYGSNFISSIPPGGVCCSGPSYNQSNGLFNTISFYNNNAYSSWGDWTLSNGRCGSAESQAQQIATNVENSWLNGQMGGSGRQEVARSVWGPNWHLCTPSGTQSTWRSSQPSTQGEAQMNGQALGFTSGNAQSFAQAQLALPGGYYWTGGPTGCSSLTWSGVNPGNYSSPFNITCPVSRHADFDWRPSSSAGQQAQAALISQIASKPGQFVSQAQAIGICQANAGVAGTCSITIQGGGGQTMPTSNITIQATEP